MTSWDDKLKDELRFRKRFQNAIKIHYDVLLHELTINMKTLNNVVNDLFETKVIDRLSFEKLMNAKSIDEKAESVLRIVLFSSATTMRRFIESFKKSNIEIYSQIVYNSKSVYLNSNMIESTNNIENNFFKSNVGVKLKVVNVVSF